MKETDKAKTAFQTPQGLFQFTRMPFGLVTAPATFARMMRKIQLPSEYTISFFDDILVLSYEFDNHIHHLTSVLLRLRENMLTARPSKIFAGFCTLEFLGFSIGEGQLKPISSKVDKILKLAVPKTKKQVRAILGLIGYYRRFCPNYAELTAPLTDLTRKQSSNTINWSDECQQSLQRIQEVLSSKPVVIIPSFSRPFLVRTDASNNSIGAVLMQEKESILHPVLYASRRLVDRETRYSTIEKECLAIVWGIQKFQRYLTGRHFSLETDHQPLAYLQKSKFQNNRLMRWSLLLQEFSFTVSPISGISNVQADLLTRCIKY